jgi:hypothetical protein
MPNRVYSNFTQLRKDTNQLIDRGRVKVHQHARDSHPELTEIEQIGIVRYGGTIQPDKNRDPTDGVYVCWARLPSRGLCRAVFCIQADPEADIVLIITAFEQE